MKGKDTGRMALARMRDEMFSSPTPPPPVSPTLVEDVARLTALGSTPAEIMLSLSLPPHTLSSILSAPDFRSLVRSFLPPVPSPEEVRGLFLDEVEKSVKTIAHLRDHAQSEKVQLSAARDILDRAGFTPIRRVATISFTLPRDRTGLVGDTLRDLVHEREEEDTDG